MPEDIIEPQPEDVVLVVEDVVINLNKDDNVEVSE